MSPSVFEIAKKFRSDKASAALYPRIYEALFSEIRLDVTTVLELGIFNGGSLQLWDEYFPNATIVGIDIELPDTDLGSHRIKMFRGLQDDVELLRSVRMETAPQGFDIIIDDCAHVGAVARRSFYELFGNHLKSSGLYCLEDWGTGYWPTWPDGSAYRAPEPKDERRIQSHDFGMVGLVKELVDHAGRGDIRTGGAGGDFLPIEFLQIFQGIVVVKKV